MKGLFYAALVTLGFVQGVAAQETGPFQLPAGGFGVPGFGQQQALVSHAMDEARRLGLFEETQSIRSGWIDRVAKITGRLDIMTAAKDADGQPISFACTGTAITPIYVLTNAHCLKTSGRHRAISALFLPNYRDARRRNVVSSYSVSLTPVERGSEDSLDYAVLRLETPLQEHQPLGFAIRDPGPGEPLVIIGHPEGQPLHLSRGRCRSDHEVPLDGSDVVHGCATLSGSSGSLVFSSEGQIVGLHFWGGSLLSGRQVNRAVRMATLVKESKILREVFEPSRNEQPPSIDLSAVSSLPQHIETHRANCAKGEMVSCASVAERIFIEGIIDEFAEDAVFYSSLACRSENLRGCVVLGLLYNAGKGVVRDRARGAELNAFACERGEPNACNNLGLAYFAGEGVKPDPVKATKLYEKACRGQLWNSCVTLGGRFELGNGVAQDYSKAAELYGVACDGGDAWGCGNLGALYSNGFGVSQDSFLAAELYRKSCKGGQMWACANLGRMYEFGAGVERSSAIAVEKYKQSCQGGSPRGCYFLADAHYFGQGVLKDQKQASLHYKMACDLGHAEACNALGANYQTGEGVALDETKALALFRQACEGGSNDGCLNLEAFGQ
ncbi:MAG: bifunctional trypsin-like peptidase domain-containing/SEL1-like repeat protein [Pelagimonas sp.]|nr:bifunctional trypsin-like peptidase domain-containing/SEL1-like repeat protein [Pelagimonas sp.]